MDSEDVFRKSYRKLTEEEEVDLTVVKDHAEEMWDCLETVSLHGADPRCMAEAKKKLEEVVMWAVKGITA